MGKIVDNEQFLLQLNQMYAGTKKWGTVRILIKRLFEKQFSYKLTKRTEQLKHEREQCADRTHEFDIVVRAANPKRKVSTMVKASQSFEFQKKLVAMMQSQMFKDIKVAAAKDKKKGKAAPVEKKPAASAKKEEVKESGAPKLQRPGAIKKNRKERRKE